MATILSYGVMARRAADRHPVYAANGRKIQGRPRKFFPDEHYAPAQKRELDERIATAPEDMFTSITPQQQRLLLEQLQLERTRRSALKTFETFLPYWHFIDRETGDLKTFGRCPLHGEEHGGEVWAGQRAFIDAIKEHDWLYALKAGKLGFTELECAFDAWRAMAGPKNARVHLFSRDDRASQQLLSYVEFGLARLPEWLRPMFLQEEAGGKSAHSLRFRLASDDVRTVVSYAAAAEVSIDLTCHHAHLDELAVMQFAERIWSSVYTTVAPYGTCHVATRGRGEHVFAARLWKMAIAGTARLFPFFTPWQARPGRDAGWYAVQEGSLSTQALRHFAPETPEDALAGSDEQAYVPIELWDRCRETLPPLITFEDGRPIVDQTPLVLALDAAVSNDCFGIVVGSRHPDPEREATDVAVRGVRLWSPPGHGGHISMADPRSFVYMLIAGGCLAGHARNEYLDDPRDGCDACASGVLVPPHNIAALTYDPYQLESIMQDIRRDGIVPLYPFQQMGERLIADSELRDLIVNRRIAHDGNAALREHIENSAAKLDAKEDRRIRIVKRAPERKIDLAVALSMMCKKVLYLNLS